MIRKYLLFLNFMKKFYSCSFPVDIVFTLDSPRMGHITLLICNQHSKNVPLFSFVKLTTWSRFLEKLIVPYPVEKFPMFYGTRGFSGVFTRARHSSLSRARSIQSKLSHSVSRRCILILSSHIRLGLPSVLFPSGSTTNIL